MADRTTKVTLKAETSNYVANMSAAQRKTEAFAKGSTQKLQAQREAMANVGKAALAMGTVAAAGVALAVKKFSDFDAEIAQLKALSHAAAPEMDKLTQAALKSGQQFGYSATQVAQAEVELTKAGISTSDMLNGALTGALTLAADGQMDVGDATQIAAEAMTQFKLKGKDVPHIADLLAAGADKALGSVGDLGSALESGGLVASQFGLSIDGTVGTLSAFAQSGLIGERAGTDLRQMLLKLASPSAEADALLKKYNITLYDAQGNFVGMSNLAGQLQTHLGKLDNATRNAALSTIFGSRAIQGANVLYAEGAKGIQSWIDKVNDQGFAADQARDKLDSLKGDVQKLGAALDTDLIKIGASAAGTLRGLVKNATDLANWIGELPKPLLDAGLKVTALIAGVGILGGGFLLLTPKIVATRAAMRELNITAKTTARSLGIITAAIAAVEFAHFTSGLVDAEQKATGFTQSLDQIQKRLADGKFKQTVDSQFNASILGIHTGIDQLHDLTDTGWLSGAITESSKFIGTMGDWNPVFKVITGGMGDLTARVKDQDKALAQLVSSGHAKQAAEAWDYMKSKTDGSKDALEKLNELFPKYKKAVKGATDGTKKSADASDNATTSTQANKQALADLADQASDADSTISDLADTINNFGKGALDVSDAERGFQQAIDDAAASVKKNGKTLDDNTQAGRDNSAALDDIARTALKLSSAQINVDTTGKTSTKTMEKGRAAFITAAEAAGKTKDEANKLADAYGLIPQNVTTAIGVTGAGQTIEQLAAMKKAWEGLNTATANAQAQANRGVNVARSPGLIAKANGGILPGAPSSRDNMYVHAASGEFITNAKATSHPSNRAALEYINAGGVMQGLAGGGMVRAPFVPAPARQTVIQSAPAPVGRPVEMVVHAAAGMSAETVGQIAANSLNYEMRRP